MTRALSGISSVIEDRDYRKTMVLAATEPVGILNLGVVAKIDLAEIRAPFMRAGVIAALLALVAIGLGGFLFVRVTGPLIRQTLESEERLKRSQEIGHLGSWELDLVTNRLTWSDEVYRIFGLKPQEFGATYEAFLDHVHPDDRAAVDAAYTGSLREGRDRYEIEHRVVRRATGEVRVVHEKCEHVRDGPGRIKRSVGMVHDVTERRRAEDDLRASEERFRTLIVQSPVAIAYAREGRTLYANPAYLRMFGFSDVNELRGRPLTEQIAPRCRNEISERARRRAQGESAPNAYETVGLRKDGTEFPFFVEISQVSLADGPATIAFFTDVTERRQAAEALARNEAEYREFTQLLAHSVKSPLSTVRLAAQQMDRERDARLSETILEQVERLNRIALGLMYLSEARTHQHETRDLNAVLEKVLEEQGVRASPELDVRLELARDLPPVRVNEAQFTRALGNLVENAVSAMNGKGVLSLATRLGDGGAAIEIEVGDTGPGIPEAYRPRLFQPFFTRKPGGTGLGLAIAKRIVEDHGGRIELSSASGAGARFRIRLPAETKPEKGNGQ